MQDKKTIFNRKISRAELVISKYVLLIFIIISIVASFAGVIEEGVGDIFEFLGGLTGAFLLIYFWFYVPFRVVSQSLKSYK